jgi:hypothetical protein
MELRLFRLMLVALGFVLAATGAGWLLLADAEREAAAAAQTSFDEYNRYIEACGDRTAGEEWDLAVRARDTLRRASAHRDARAFEAGLVLRVGLATGAALVVGFYALRWALTGRVRPWWLLGAQARPAAAHSP